MKFLKEQYQKDAAFFRGPLLLHLRNATAAFFIILLIAYIACLLLPAVRDMLVAYIQTVVENADIVDDGGQFSAWKILGNNLRASITSTVLGCIPLLYLTALPIGLNAAVLGAMAAYYQFSGYSLLLFAVGIVPHGIVEIPALLIAFACGLYLCKELTGHIMRPEEHPQPLSEVFLAVVRVYLTIILPMLIVAAFLEAYVTPLCMALFL